MNALKFFYDRCETSAHQFLSERKNKIKRSALVQRLQNYRIIQADCPQLLQDMATICGDPEAQNAATLFPKFSQLPLELRLQIWLMTLPGPRRIGPRHRTHIDTQIEIKDFQTPDPIALQINRESRELALKYYTPRNPTHLASWSKKDNCSYNTHIDFTNDLTVLIDATRHFSLTRYPFVLNPPKDYTTTSFSNRFFSREEMNKITNLTLISEDFSFVLFHVKEWLQDWLPIFKSLKKCEFRVWVPEAERGLMSETINNANMGP
ncbi:hypothetical protein G7Y89_g15463 [Cudoniella acicularis]|uniref:2EXR domain-containing protein n=1 Tax=Cudoniella acicularis TaxID=354080 RepID=A0A8H4VMM4_9HELO|nr:hypothetical protein G7Y89_g15463 [Cudoniella acicularis]